MPAHIQVAIIGAGPAGLTAGYLLAKAGVSCVVFEKDPDYVGGISRTETYRGFCFEIGGHRFFSKSPPINELWNEILPDGFVEVPRESRIFFRGQFYAYPLRPFEALGKLGLAEAFRSVASFLYAKLKPIKEVRSFEDWVTNQFGRRLFDLFFRTYTEKVWGMKTSEISSDWAAQRINNLNLARAIANGFRTALRIKPSNQIKSLIGSFRYPRKGPGMFWEKCRERIVEYGGVVQMGCTAEVSDFQNEEWLLSIKEASGEKMTLRAEHVICSAPLSELAQSLAPILSEATQTAGKKLRYRDFINVNLILREPPKFSDQWIYIHDPRVKVARIANYRSWSADMLPHANAHAVRLEYFCFEGDGLWCMSDSELIALATQELTLLNLVESQWVLDGLVVRQPKAYPVYDEAYESAVQTIRDEISRRFPSLHPVGRNGMHKYNNQDHSMMTAMLTAENIIAGQFARDPWNVNQDAEYLESTHLSTIGLRHVPRGFATIEVPG